MIIWIISQKNIIYLKLALYNSLHSTSPERTVCGLAGQVIIVKAVYVIESFPRDTLEDTRFSAVRYNSSYFQIGSSHRNLGMLELNLNRIFTAGMLRFNGQTCIVNLQERNKSTHGFPNWFNPETFRHSIVQNQSSMTWCW